MARKELQGRDNWQTESGPGGKAGVAEHNLLNVFKEAFEGTNYRISDHPTDLKHLYESVAFFCIELYPTTAAIINRRHKILIIKFWYFI